MEEAVISHELSQLDYTKVAALQQKRTLAFVNHFILTTVNFLNNFVRNCETKFQTFERKLQKVEASLIILETKLSSVPGLESSVDIHNTQSDTTATVPPPNEESEMTENSDDVVPTMQNKQDVLIVEYERFVKMVQMGVPLDAVKIKVKLEGLDPDYLSKHIHK